MLILTRILVILYWNSHAATNAEMAAVPPAGSSIVTGMAKLDNRIMGCVFTDWRGKAMKRRWVVFLMSKRALL